MAQRHTAKNPRDSDNYLVKGPCACVSHITIVEVTRMVAWTGDRRLWQGVCPKISADTARVSELLRMAVGLNPLSTEVHGRGGPVMRYLRREDFGSEVRRDRHLHLASRKSARG